MIFRLYILALAIFISDQVSKFMILSWMQPGDSITILDNFFYIVSHSNEGAAFGLLQGQQLLLIFISSLIIFAVAYSLAEINKSSRKMAICCAVVLGGALGNLFDRIRLGCVTDFLLFSFGEYSFPVFNLADIAVVCGLILLMLFGITTKEGAEK